MKRILLFLLIFSSVAAKSQQFNNEWIDYNKTYYKFKVPTTGLMRINQSTLLAAGLQTVPAENFQLWRNGQQVALFTSVATGQLGASDYIEFWGEMNDGKPDNIMYRISDYQPSDKWSLQSDTAVYFLTNNPAGPNLRYATTANTPTGMTPDPYFIYTTGKYWRDRINQGFANVVGENVYAAAYDAGEGWGSGDIGKGVTVTQVFSNLNIYTGAGAPDPNFRIHASGYNGLNPRTFRVKVNGDSILGVEMNFFDYVKVNKDFPIAKIASGTASFELTNTANVPDADRMVVSVMELKYPHTFDFGGATNFQFTLAANSSGNYLQITNFSAGSGTPVLYDRTNNRRYVADASTPGMLKFTLLGSGSERNLVLVSEDNSNIRTVSTLTVRSFVNYGLAANQGNYLIITAPQLLDATNGSHPVDDYKAYRASAAGGSFNPKIYMIDELVDQFAFGIRKHPLSIRNFLRWARATYTSPIKDVLLMGKGVQYIQYRTFETNPNIDRLAIIPTFGHPASDMLLAAEPGLDEVPKTPIGRLAVISGDEIIPYLNKVKEYELAQATPSPLIKDKAWMKNIIHVVGADEDGLTTSLLNSMASFKRTAVDTFYGGKVNTFSKTSADNVELQNISEIQNLFAQGLGLVTYFGHSSASTLEFNLDNPQNYNNQGKYPLFVLLGCNAGGFFNFNTLRLQTKETISEKFVLAQDRGSIATIASTHLGIVHYLDIYGNKLYNSFSNTKYGQTMGEIMIEAIKEVFTQVGQGDFNARLHCEESTLHGDPALKMSVSFPKPDYVIEDQLVRINPAFISVAEPNFKVDAKFMNIGKAISDSTIIEVKRTYPNNNTVVIRRDTIPGIRYIDSILYTIPIVPTSDKGLNKITITIDPDNKVPELFETNNSITKEFFIFEDEARPVYPINFAIINKQGIKFHASTANPFSSSRNYTMEIDTTVLFNSPLKASRSVTTTGGVVTFDPGVTFTDSTVYYWRVSPEPTTGERVWNNASFIYLPNSATGVNQSHFYQQTKSEGTRISLDSTSRLWKYEKVVNNLFLRMGTYNTSGSTQELSLTVSINGDPKIQLTNFFSSLVFNVIHPVTFQPWRNDVRRVPAYVGEPANPTSLGLGYYGSTSPYFILYRPYNFEYRYTDTSSRRKMMDFMRDSIPDGYYVVVRNFTLDPATYPAFPVAYANDWKADESLHGAGQSLYHYLKNAGFSGIDSFYRPRPFGFVYKKNDPAFTPKWVVGDGVFDNPTLSVDCPTTDTLGYIKSPVFGRSKHWKELIWRGTSAPDITPGDKPTIDVLGVAQDGVTETLLFQNISTSQQNFDLQSVNTAQYPYMRLRMRNQDSVHYTPYQMRYWRITFDPAPEGAVAPNLYFSTKDTVDVGEPLDFQVAFKNIGEVEFDSMKVQFAVTDKRNLTTIIPVPRRRKLGFTPDTLHVGGSVPTNAFSGNNVLYIEVNPDDDQPEQYHFNNFAFKNFYVRPDTLSPLLDVTFDGVHILNRDIVAAKPDIVVKLKDESKWMILNDTSLLKLEVKYPNGQVHRYYFNNDTLQFLPAGQAPNTSNTATLNFKPYFLTDGEYELTVTGKDRSDNTAGRIQYKVTFQVINKPMISNMLNYPNPFTTSTAFVFTITGAEVPQNIRIQIMTITGKIVRDITKDELGPLHIGRNITEFKWDGTDQYGQKLANGIYLYRVITNLNGKSLDKYKADGDETDKYFNKGYGKMYLMR